MLLTFKIHLNLNNDQIQTLESISNEARLLYNHYLNEKIDYYNDNKKYLSYFTQQKTLKDYKTEYLTFDVKKEVLRILNNNYKSFFQLLKHNKYNNPQIPKFRSKKYFFTLSYVQDFIIKNNQLVLSLQGYKKLNIDLNYVEPIEGLHCERNKSKSDIKQVKLFRKDNQYFASIVYEKKEQTNKTNDIIAIDLGKLNLSAIYNPTTNDGTIYSSSNLNKNLKYYDKRIDELKSKRDKKTKGSNKSKQLNNKVKKLNNKRNHQTKLSLHKLSKDLSNKNTNIVIGELTNLKQNTTTKVKRINRQLQNNWNLTTFIRLLEYKTKLKGNQVIKVNEAWTSKTCSKCGSIMEHQTLSNRQYKCDCGLDIDRDLNGAINIYKQYLGDYNTPIDFDLLSESKRFAWCDIKQMNEKNYVKL